MPDFEIAGLRVAPGQRGMTWLPVCRLLLGAELRLPLHVIHGAEPGPVLGLVALVHGVEYVPVRMLAEGLRGIDSARLSGTVLAIPVANPPAFSARQRNTPERDSDIANLNRVFPGGVGAQEHGNERHSADRGMTERMADAIMAHFLPRLDYLVDFHHVQEPRVNREAMFVDRGAGQGEKGFALARAFGAGLLQALGPGMHPGSISAAAASLGATCCTAEVGGGFLGKAVEDRVVAMGKRGVLNVCRHLGMLPGELELPRRQCLVTKRVSVRPSTAGYFVADLEAEDLIGDGLEYACEVRKGQRLGVVLDPYTLEVVEEIRSPVDGYPIILRRTGLCEAGDRGIALGVREAARWIE